MRTLYIECTMGAAGDMLTAALSELLPDKAAFFEELAAVVPEGVEVCAETVGSMGINGTSVSVKIHGEEEHSHDVHGHGHHHEHEHHHGHEHGHHHHTSMQDIERLIGGMKLSDRVKSDALAVYRLIAEAESRVHGREVSEIHFHEVGTLDAVTDICAVCMLIERLGAERIVVSPVTTGFGHVHCAHGILPVPAPATALLLEGIPSCAGDIEGELCTPTGAALLRHFADSFGQRPVMRTEGIGCGLGKKQFERLNCVRAFIGESEEKSSDVCELVCSVDDMTGEAVGYAIEKLISGGALDAYAAPIVMKKGRPAFELTCLCTPESLDGIVRLIFGHTTTIGIRERGCRRYTLSRSSETVGTQYGDIRVKTSEGYGVKRVKPEHDDLAAAADRAGVSLETVRSGIGL